MPAKLQDYFKPAGDIHPAGLIDGSMEQHQRSECAEYRTNGGKHMMLIADALFHTDTHYQQHIKQPKCMPY